jgi:hypothetical protein
MKFSKNELFALVEANTNVWGFGLTKAQNAEFMRRFVSASKKDLMDLIFEFIIQNELHRALGYCEEYDKNASGDLTPEAKREYTFSTQDVERIIKRWWIPNLEK